MRLNRFSDASCQAVKHFLFLPNPLFTYKQAHTQTRNTHTHTPAVSESMPDTDLHSSASHPVFGRNPEAWDCWPVSDSVCDLVRERKRAVFSCMFQCDHHTTHQNTRHSGKHRQMWQVTCVFKDDTSQQAQDAVHSDPSRTFKRTFLLDSGWNLMSEIFRARSVWPNMITMQDLHLIFSVKVWNTSARSSLMHCLITHTHTHTPWSINSVGATG